MNRKGITLIASIMLIVFASIAVLGVTTFIVERLKQNEAKSKDLQCVYLAQAGIHKALYDYFYNSRVTKGKTNIDVDNFFVLGGTAADFLMVDTTSTRFYNDDLIDFDLRNATNSTTITIGRMIVTWSDSSSESHRHLREIRLHDDSVWHAHETGVHSPADIDISNFSLTNAHGSYGSNKLVFDNDEYITTVNVEFVMTDGSSQTVVMYPASNNNKFNIKATGKTAGSNIYRTIQAAYNDATSKLTYYEEINTEITP